MALRSIVFALALAAGPAAASAATYFDISGGAVSTVPGGNDFKSYLNGLNLKRYSDVRGISLVGTGRVTFAFLGAESGYHNSFKIGSQVFYTENANANKFGAPVVFHTGIFNATTFKPSFYTASPLGAGQPGNGNGFGIFSPISVGTNGFKATTVYFGFDDRTPQPDRDFDDIIVSATVSAVPEPTVWAAMLLGFGMIGAALRRRSARATHGGLATG